MPISGNLESRLPTALAAIDTYKKAAVDTTGSEKFASTIGQAEIAQLMQESEAFKNLVLGKIALRTADLTRLSQQKDRQIRPLYDKFRAGTALTPSERDIIRTFLEEVKQVLEELYTEVAERILVVEEKEVGLNNQLLDLQRQKQDAVNRQGFGADVTAELQNIDAEVNRTTAELDLLSDEKAVLQEFFTAFSGGDMGDALITAQSIRTDRDREESDRLRREEDSRRKEAEVNWSNYGFFIEFMGTVRDVVHFQDFFRFSGLDGLKPTDRNDQKRVKEFFTEALKNPEMKRRIYFDMITALLMLLDEKINDNSSPESGALRLPGGAATYRKKFFDPRVAGQSPYEYEQLRDRLPEEVRTVLQFFRAKIIAVEYDDTVGHQFAGLYSSDKVPIDKVKADFIDSEAYKEITSDYISAGRFSQSEFLEDEDVRDKVWYLSRLLSSAMDVYDRATRNRAHKLVEEGIEVPNAIPFINKEPKEMFEAIYVVIGTKLLRILFSQGEFDKHKVPGFENLDLSTFLAMDQAERKKVLDALPQGLKIQIDLAVRQAFLIHKTLLNESAKDLQATQFEFSEAAEPVFYYGSGKTLSAGGSSKKLADDGQRLLRSYLVPMGEFIHGLAVLPTDAVITSTPKDSDPTQEREIDIYDYIDYLKAIYGQDLSKSPEYRTFLGQFSYRKFFNPDGTIKEAEVKDRVVFFRIHPKYLQVPVDDSEINTPQKYRDVLKQQPIHFVNKRDFQRKARHVGLHVPYNDVAFRLGMRDYYVERTPAGEEKVAPTVNWEFTTENPIANYGRFWGSAMIWHSLLDVTSEKPLVNVDVVEIPVERRRNLSQRAQEWSSRFKNKVKGNVALYTRGISLDRKEYDLEYLRKELVKAQNAGDAGKVAELQEKITNVPVILQDYRQYEDLIDSMLYVDVSEISEQDYKVTFGASKVFEVGIHYLIEAIKTAKARTSLETRTDSSGRPVDVQVTGKFKTMDLIRTMFRDVMDGPEGKGFFFPPELDKWVEVFENAKDAEDERVAEAAIKIELQMMQFMLYLNRYTFDQTKTGDIRFYSVANVETKSGKPPLTLTQRYKFTYLVARFIQDVIQDKFGKGDEGQIAVFQRAAAEKLAEEFAGTPLGTYFDSSPAYDEAHIAGRMYQIYERLGLYGSPESAILAMKFAETQLGKLDHPADLEQIDVDDKGRVVEKRLRFLDFQNQSSQGGK